MIKTPKYKLVSYANRVVTFKCDNENNPPSTLDANEIVFHAHFYSPYNSETSRLDLSRLLTELYQLEAVFTPEARNEIIEIGKSFCFTEILGYINRGETKFQGEWDMTLTREMLLRIKKRNIKIWHTIVENLEQLGE